MILKIMAPKRTTRSSSTTTTTTTTPVTNAQLKALIDQGVANALATRDADRSQNGEDSHDCGTGELTLMCDSLFPEESDKIKRYVGGLPDMIVMASKPKIMQDAIEFATKLMDKKISTLAERDFENKTKLHNNNNLQRSKELKNQNHINQARGTGAHGMVHALGGETNQDLDIIEEDINA
nr:hypothetical protein [Tanacetum cinerariifolium]